MNYQVFNPAFLYDKIKNKKLNYSTRFIICPETIGSIAYLNKKQKKLKKNVLGYQITCCGLNSKFVYKKSKKGIV